MTVPVVTESQGLKVLSQVVSMISVHCYNQDYLIDHLFLKSLRSARYKLMMFYKGSYDTL